MNLTISNPYSPTWREIIGWLNIFGYKIELIQANKWMEDYFFKADVKNAGYKIRTLYMNDVTNKKIVSYDPVAVESKNTVSAINALNMDFPAINMEFFFRYLNYLIRLEFLSQSTISKTKLWRRKFPRGVLFHSDRVANIALMFTKAY